MAVFGTVSKGKNNKRWNKWVAFVVASVAVIGALMGVDTEAAGLAVLVSANCLANVWLLGFIE